MLTARQSSRRKFLLASVLSLPAIGVAVKMLSAAEAAEMAAPELDDYQPVFFTAAEWRFVVAACDRLIPADGRGPGALETNVPIFIDQQLHEGLGSEIYLEGPFDLNAPPEMGYQIPYGPKQIYQNGIKAAEAWCQKQYGKSFSDLSASDRDAALAAMQGNKVDFTAFDEAVLKPSVFFAELWADSKDGYMADPMYGGNKGMKAWIAIGFPGARASYTEWVTQHNVKYPLGPVSVSGMRA